VAEIAEASQEQSSGIAQVLNAVAQMDKVTQGNAASAEESAAAAEELSAQARMMDEAVGQLKNLVGGHALAHGHNVVRTPAAPAHLAEPVPLPVVNTTPEHKTPVAAGAHDEFFK
jgi:hypothetical protein